MRSKRNGPQRHTALVTGGSAGIGLELAKVLARNGYDLVLVSRTRDALEAAAGQIEGKHDVKAHVFAADLRRREAPESIFDFLHNENIPIEILVNNAGFGLGGEFADTELTRELEMIQVNIAALTHLTKLFLPAMIKAKSGRVLNIASTAAFQPGPLMAVYYASKAYVLSFSEAIASELNRTGVKVTALCPGPTDTEFQKRAGVETAPAFQGPIMMDSMTVARIGYRGMIAGKRVVIAGVRNKIMAGMSHFTPRPIVLSIVKKMNEAR